MRMRTRLELQEVRQDVFDGSAPDFLNVSAYLGMYGQPDSQVSPAKTRRLRRQFKRLIYVGERAIERRQHQDPRFA